MGKNKSSSFPKHISGLIPDLGKYVKECISVAFNHWLDSFEPSAEISIHQCHFALKEIFPISVPDFGCHLLPHSISLFANDVLIEKLCSGQKVTRLDDGYLKLIEILVR